MISDTHANPDPGQKPCKASSGHGPAHDPAALLVLETDEQFARLSALARDIWTEHYTPIIGIEQVRYMLDCFQSPAAVAADVRERGFRYTVAESDGQWLGYSATVHQREGVLFLSKLYVHQRCRGSGIGRLLFEDVVTQARQAGCEWIELTVNRGNAESIAVYRHLGFETCREQCADIGGGFVMDDLVMVRPV